MAKVSCYQCETSVPMEGDDDKFELYDLRVEVICPPGEPIYCGAKQGDHFYLRGEMLHFPEGQGFSIYSLGEWHTREIVSYD